MSKPRPKPWCIAAPQLRNAEAGQQQIYKLENSIVQRLVGGERWADWFGPSRYSQLILQIGPGQTSRDPLFQDMDPRITCWYTYEDPSFPEELDEDSEDTMDWFEVTEAELAKIRADEAERDDDYDDPEEWFLTEAELAALAPMFESALRTCIDATGHHLRLDPPPWDEAAPPTEADGAGQRPPAASAPGSRLVRHPDPAPQSLVREEPESSLPLGDDLVFEVHVPSTDNFPHPWVDAIEEYLGGLDGSDGEESDEPESLEDEYLYFLAGAPEARLIENATRIARLPGVPAGVYVTVSDAEGDMGESRRIDLKTNNV